MAVDGYGSGSGYGYGDGSGYGYGDGYGYGYGSGSGSSSGYGSGYGYGDGSGLSEAYTNHPLVPAESVVAFWRSDKDGRPANGGQGEPVHVGMVQKVDGPLRLCTRNALHGDLDPSRWSGERWWVVALVEPVQRDGTKVGSLKRVIVEELV